VSRHTPLKRALVIALVATVGLLLAEGFTRLAFSRVVAMSLWFTPGIHQPDSRFGFVYTPGYRGLMQHTDHVVATPLVLDDHGLRPSIASRAESRDEVVLMGGASFAFSYGLTDEASIAGRLAARSAHRIRVVTCAWPGYALYGSWTWYRERLLADSAPRVVVLMPTPMQTKVPVRLPRIPPAYVEEIFHYVPGLALRPTGAVARRLGSWGYRSLLLHKLARFLDEELPGPVRDALAPPPAPRLEPTPREPLAAFLERVRADLAPAGAEILVAWLPQPGEPAGLYRTVDAAVPAEYARVDVHRRMVEQGLPMPTLAAGHFAAPTADAIARILIEEIDPMLAHRGDVPRRD
jgi:hypothetical protein